MKTGMQFDSRQVSGTVTLREHYLPISLAQNEIAKLHQISVTYEHGVVTASSMRGYFSLKTVKEDGAVAPETENALIEDKHTFWRIAHRLVWSVDGYAPHTWKDKITWNPPIILVRTPRIVFYGGSGGPAYLNIFCYYTKEKVSKSDLTVLMVKRHH